MKTLDEIKPNELYLPREIAPLLKVSERAVQRYIADGRLRATKGTGNWRVLGSAVLAFLGLSAADLTRSTETKPQRNARVKRCQDRLREQGILPTADVGGA